MQRLAHTALLVRDYDEAIAYFTGLLGFSLFEDTDLGNGKRWVVVGPPGEGGSTLLLARAASPDQMARIGDQTGGRVFLFVHTDDFWRDYRRMAEQGVEFVEQPRVEQYGTVVVFRDLYGNKWDLIERATSTFQEPPVVRAQMLIRKPVSEVFEAFVDPAITTRFWFTKSSGQLEPGASVRWDWEMYGVSADVRVIEVDRNRRILVEWDDPPRPVEWLFAPRADDATLVTISSWGFGGTDAEVTAQALDSMGGFTVVLAGLKALLEQGVALNLVADQFPGDTPPADAAEPQAGDGE